MADLLRKGYTMLNLSCPACHNPIFKDKSGDMHCPSCNKPVIFSKDLSSNGTQQTDLSKHKSFENNYNEIHDVLKYLKEILMQKIKKIADLFDKESNFSLFTNYLQIIENLIKTLNQIQDFEENYQKNI